MPGRATGLLLTVKQTVPPVRAGAVRRDRLQHRLRDADTRLVTLVAPAGWGKTSLLSAWACDPSERSRIAWVSLDDGDDEPARFWSYVLTALHASSDEISSRALDALGAPGVDPLEVALPVLLNELAEVSVPHVLVLDDYHVITDPRIHEAVEFLLTYLPEATRLVMAGRSDPPLPIARLRASGQLTEFRAAELRFSRDEAAALLSRVSETELDGAASAAVWGRTEGWAAGLQLAGLTLRGAPDATSAAARITGGDRHLVDYFAAEIIPGLSPRQRDLLVRAAPLERLSGGLCDAALQVTGSAEVLAELDRADLFVTALDTDREWYRCHRLLRDALQASRTPPPAGTREVLARAADWFARNDRLDQAAAHLLRSGDEVATAGFLEANILWFSAHGQAAGFLALGEQLPETVIGPELALWLSYAAMVSGRQDRAVTWLDACEARIAPDTVLAGWRHAGAAALSMRASIGIPFADTALAVERARRALELETAAGNPSNNVARSNLGVALLRDGAFAEAAELLGDSWRGRDHHDEWSRAVALQIAGCLGLSLLELGRDPEADQVLREAGPLADAAERDWGDAASMASTLRVVEGRLRYQQGDSAAARALLVRAVALAEVLSRPTALVLGLVYLADAEVGCGDRPAARAALWHARDIVHERGAPPFIVERLESAELRLGRGSARVAARAGALAEELTDRELSILRILPGQASQREIGAALFLSINTVKAYNKSLYRKLGVASRREAVAAARSLGLI